MKVEILIHGGGVGWKGIPTGVECIQLEKVDSPKMLH